MHSLKKRKFSWPLISAVLKAQGIPTGKSLVEPDKVEEVSAMLAEAARRGVTILLPQDHVVVAELKAGVPFALTSGREIPDDKLGVDIGP
jgi:phosphoglycerate kinase